MNFMIYFWFFFSYAMTFGLPLYIHYSSNVWYSFKPGQSPGMAFSLLCLGCMLWVVLLVWFTKKCFLSRFKEKAMGAQLFREGKKGYLIAVITGLLLIISTMLFLLVFGYLYESRGYGWRYLTFWHPFILIPLMGCVYLGCFTLLSPKLWILLISKLINTSKTN